MKKLKRQFETVPVVEVLAKILEKEPEKAATKVATKEDPYAIAIDKIKPTCRTLVPSVME